MEFINGDFTFHPVGQGLFHSGRISCANDNLQTNFVYDCGTADNGENFENIVEKYAGSLPGKSLDMLILSHFHIDHISGLRLLFDEGITIKKCFIPYFTPEERFIIWASVWNELGDEEWYFNFLMDPITYLINNKVEQVIIIDNGSDDGGENEDPTPSESSDNSDQLKEEDIVNVNKLVKDDKLEKNILESEPEPNGKQWKELIINGDLLIRSNRGYVTISCAWYFKFFNSKNKIKKQIEKFKDCLKEDKYFKDLLNNEKFLYINNEKFKNKLKLIEKCYKNIFNKAKINLNITSLVVYHSPIIRSNNKFQVIWRNCFFPCFCCHRYYFEFFYYDKYLRNKYITGADNIMGQLLTGDAGLKSSNNINEFKKHYKKVLNNVFLFQLPHHGSEHNWNKKLLNFLPFCNIWIASAGLHNSYNHPSYEVFRNIANYNRMPMLISECNEFSYGFKIRKIQ
jgi:ribonuclease BN (tRNA processing enzyme)